jgi:Sugar-transfer associated ATP-grasp
MKLSLTDQIKHNLGLARKRFLNVAETWIYDLVGLPMAIRYLFGKGNHLHEFYAKQYWKLPFGPLRAIITIILYPVALVIAIFTFTIWNGRDIKARSGISVWQQVLGQFSMAIKHSIAPFWYYMFELYHPEKAQTASQFLMAHETIGPAFTLLQPKDGVDLLPDKVWFAAHCRKMNIMAVPVFLYLSAGQILKAASQETELPLCDLFIKPRQGNGGHNAERWDYLGVERYQNSTGKTLTRDELLAALLELSLRDDFIIQPRLINHPALADISNDALSTVRVLTCRNEQGEPEATNVAFRMAVGGNSVVDNFHQGGLAAAVNMKSGAIGEASDIGIKPGMGWRDVHPVSGIKFKDRILPDWQGVLDLAVAAHKAFPHRIMVGWDVAMLKDGPMIIEGNGKPDLDIHQRVERGPLGNARIAQLVVFNLEKYLTSARA